MARVKGENHLFPDCPGRFAALGALCIFVVTGCGGGAAPEKKTTNAPAVDDKFVNPDGSTTTSSYLIQKVEGAPDKYSNAASVTITVTRRNGESTIKYKAANADKKECLREKNWSAPSSASNFTIDTSGLTDGDAILCLRATDPQGREDSNDVYFQWLHDLTPPKSPTSVRMTSPVPPATVTSSRSVSLRWVPAEDQDPANKAAPSLTKSHKVMVGTTPGGNDVLQQTYGVADYESNLTLPRDGEFYFSVAAIDNAGNQTVTQISSVISVDESAPPAPASITWNPVGPTNQTTGIVVSWPAVTENTAVTYQYKVGTAAGLSDTIGVTPASGTQATLTLPEGTHYFSVKSVNSVLLSSDWYQSTVPFYVDLTKPMVQLHNNPNGLTVNYQSLDVSISTAARSQLNIHQYAYKVITGTNCSTSGSWSDWLPSSTPIPDNIQGPAFETTMSICVKVRDAAGNESDPDATTDYRAGTWTNQDPGATADFSDTVKAKISYASTGTIRDFTSNSGAWVANASSATPVWANSPSRTVTSTFTFPASGSAQFTGAESINGAVRKTTITRTPAPSAGSNLDSAQDISQIPGEVSKWCVGDLYLLDLATDSGAGTENFHALVSCVTPGATVQQKIRVISYDTGVWSSYAIASRATTTKAMGAVSVNSEIFVAIVDPTNSNSVYTCGSPPDTTTIYDCESSVPSKWKPLPGSAGTTALAALVPSSNNGIARVVIAGSLSGVARLGVASGFRTGNLALKWMATDLGAIANFSLNPYLIEIP